MKTWIICLLSIVFCAKENVYADPIETSGTLIVTYKTDKKGERLDRIRFWLSKEEERLGFYPQGSFFVEDPKEMSRMVVIDNLSRGTYRLRFLVPNLDGYFEEAPIREITISEGEIFKIDQKICRNEPSKTPLSSPQKSPVFGSLIVSYDWDKTKAQEIYFRLISSSGKTTRHPQESDLEISMDSGKIVHIPKIESGRYQLDFFLKGKENSVLYTLKDIQISPDHPISLHENIKF